MESTGKYWIPIWNILEDEIKLTLAHPKYKKAIIAIARMILVSIYHIILNGETFNPYDIDELSNPISKEQASSKSLNEEDALIYFKSLGYIVSKPQLNQ